MTDLWAPLMLSVCIASAATGLTAAVGIPLAYVLGRWRVPGRWVIEAALVLPLVLPPTVVGYFLLVLLGRRGWFGSHLFRWTHGYSPLFRPEAGVVAAAVVSLPLLYLPVKAAFAAVDKELEDVATVMGAGRLRVFWHVSLPLARRGIAGGVLLAFGRAVGEFGATTMVMGSTDETQTLPIAIYSRSLDGDLAAAAPAVWALTAVSLLIVLLCNRSGLLRR